MTDHLLHECRPYEEAPRHTMAWAIPAFIAGGLLAFLSWHPIRTTAIPTAVIQIGLQAIDKVGLVIYGLVPLAIWAVLLILKQIRSGSSDQRMELDYAYIARTSTLLGLLGTITSLGLATSRLGGEVAAGSSAAILKVIPYTGQALVSTMVGLVIALLAETALHFIERKHVTT